MEITTVLHSLSGNGATFTALWLLILPLLAFAVLFLLGKKLPRQGDWLGIGITGVMFLLALYLFGSVWQQEPAHLRVPWFSLPGSGDGLSAAFYTGIYLDNLSVLMLVIVTFISLLVQLYSTAYMHHDPQYNRYFAYLSLFTFSMIGIVLSNNLLWLFMCWELVGFASYLLIGFWFEKDAAAQASKKAFLVNRVGDIGLLLGLFVLYAHFRTFDLQTLKALINTANYDGLQLQLSYTFSGHAYDVTLGPVLLTLAGLGLFLGCVGKSAQFPLQLWLPDAMEGPTPVSSLIHAATMVAAGVFLLSRCFVFFTTDALTIMAFVGAITALLGALAALQQHDIKKVLAYSTISQLGYMVAGMGVGAHDASLFHLATHAFFKAALFLNAGILIHALHQAAHRRHDHHFDAQDMRKMGGFRKIMPKTFCGYLLALGGLVGLPLFSGFLSKDAILTGTWIWASRASDSGNFIYYFVPLSAFLVVLLTAFYMGRHLVLVFLGEPRHPFRKEELRTAEGQEAPRVMLWPVLLLSLLSLGIFFSVNPFSFSGSWVMKGLDLHRLHPEQALLSYRLLPDLFEREQEIPYVHNATGILTTLLGLFGLGLAWWRYGKRSSSEILAAEPATAPEKLALHHFYLDRLMLLLVVRPGLWLAKLASSFDTHVLDGVVNGAAALTAGFAAFIGWFDKVIIDGLALLPARLSAVFGRGGSAVQTGKVQTYFGLAMLAFALLTVFALFF